MASGLALDFRAALRALRASRTISGAAILTLALAIGALSAIFSVANSVMLRPLPVRDPQHLVTITSDTALRFGFQAGAGWSYTMWDRLRERAAMFDGAFAWILQPVDAAADGEARPLQALFASGGFFTTLGVPAAIGRTFTDADDMAAGGPDGAVAVISHDFWRRRFAGAATAVGSRLPIDGTPVTIIGVAPRRFRGVDVGQPFDVAIPLGAEPLIRGPRSVVTSQRALLLTVMARLKPGQTRSAAEAALRTVQTDIVGTGVPAFLKEPFVLAPASTGITDRSRLRQVYERPLVTLAIVSGLVLLIVSVNLTNLFLARATGRRQELSVRLAIGAPRWRLARQLLAEGVLLGAISMAAALPFAAWASRALIAHLPAAAFPVILDGALDWRVLAFTGAAAATAVLMVVAVPALYATRVPSLEAMHETGRVSGGRRTSLFSSVAVVAQVALSIVLLAAAGMFGRTLNRLANVPLGFDPQGLLVVTINGPRAPRAGVPLMSRYERIAGAVRTVPGVEGAAGSFWTPVSSAGGGLLTDARGRRADIGGSVAFNIVTPGWFGLYRTVIRSGRDFYNRDSANAPRVAVINESLHDKMRKEGRAGDGTIHAGPCDQTGCMVIGIVADTVYGGSLRDAPPPTLYLPLAQSGGAGPSNAFRVSVRAGGDLSKVTPALANALRTADGDVAFTIKRLDAEVDSGLAQERLMATLAGFFGAVALVLSAVGLYGVSSHAVSRRRAEIGIRLALGARTALVIRAIAGRILLFVLAGSIAGLAAASWLSRFVASLLYGLAPRDPAILWGATIILASVATLAAVLPVWRATRVDPARVLRQN